MTLWEAVADLALAVESYRLERRSVQVARGWTRVTTGAVLEGDGVRGEGEDVSYTAADHDAWPAALPLAGETTLAGFSERLERLDLWDRPPSGEHARDYRRWGVESAALDLALRQAGRSLGEALGRPARPVRFVVSGAAIDDWLAVDPTLEFKLDADPGWSPERIAALAATGRVRVLDFKAHYTGDWIEVDTDPGFYRRIVEGFPDAILEDAAWTEATAPILAPHADRLSWDAPVRSAEDLDQLPVEPRRLNVKPSRFGTVRALLDALDACEARGIRRYGGGQFELGPGRRQIQALAALFYPDAPNDVAPGDYNTGGPRGGLPRSPLDPPDPGGPGFGLTPVDDPHLDSGSAPRAAQGSTGSLEPGDETGPDDVATDPHTPTPEAP